MSENSPRDTRRIRARIFWLHDKPLTKGDQILVRLGTRETRATVVAIEKAVDPGELSSIENKSIARNHVGEIDISLAQPIAADPYTDNPRTGRLVIEVNGRIAGGGLVLSVDAGQRAIPIDIVPVESALASRRALGALSTQRRGGLADRDCRAPANRHWRARWSAGCSAMAVRRSCWMAIRLRAGLNGDLGFSAQDRSENIRRLAEVATHLARNGHIAIVAAVSPSAEDRAAARRIADTAFREIYVATPAEVCESRDPKGHYAKARAGTLHAFTGIGNDYQPPIAPRIDDRHLDTPGSRRHRRDRADAGEIRRSVRRTGRPGRQYLASTLPAIVCEIRACERPSQGPGFGAKRALNAALCGAVCFLPQSSRQAPLLAKV